MSTNPEDLTPPKGTVQYDASQVVIFSSRARQMLADASDYAIDSPELYFSAAEDLQRVKALAKQVEDTRVSITNPLHQAKTAVDRLFKGPMEFLTQAETTLKRAMLAWDNEQERIRREEQRRAEEARRVEEARLAAEQRAREEQARRQEEEARRLEEDARAAEAAGNTEQADQLLQQAVVKAHAAEDAAADAHALASTAAVLTMPTATPVQKVSGISTSKTVDFEVTSVLELAKHVAQHPELVNLLAVDSVKLRAYVRGLGLNCQLPGVRVYEKKTLSARAA